MTNLAIRKELVIKAPREKVWTAITTTEGWSSWFGESVECGFQVGDTMRQDFGNDQTCWAVVTRREERAVFGYRWHPGEDCGFDKYPAEEMTEVVFELSDDPEGTRLVLTEVGFERIPESRRDKCVKLNDDGWDWELEELRAWTEDGVRHSKSTS